jgi:hypothetical protein
MGCPGMRRTLGSHSRAAAIGMCLGVALLGGCVVYPAAPYPAPVSYGPSTFDRAFDAALGALSDQGLRITSQDRASGHIVGARGTVTVTASVRPQADGTTRVEFKTSGDTGQDAGISQRVLGAYNARMGR